MLSPQVQVLAYRYGAQIYNRLALPRDNVRLLRLLWPACSARARCLRGVVRCVHRPPRAGEAMLTLARGRTHAE